MRLLIFLFFISYSAAYAQYDAEIKVIHRVKEDSILIRWAPSTPIAWQLANKYGYKLMRYELTQTADSVTSEKPVLVKLFKVLPVEEWENLVKKNQYAAIAAQAIYGEDFKLADQNTSDLMSIYDQVSELENRFSFSLYAADLSVEVAKAMGMLYVDTDYNKNKRYVYRILLADNSSSYKINSGATLVDSKDIKKLPEPIDLKGEFGDHMVRLSWNSFFDQQVYIGYQVERSSDGGTTFLKRNEVPLSVSDNNSHFDNKIVFIDSLEQNYKLYQYRIRGFNSFGEIGPPSQAVQGAGLGSAGGVIAYFDTTFINKNGEAYLEWIFPSEMRENLIGFKVGRADNAKGPFEVVSDLLPPHTSNYTDPYPESVNYYVVKALGKDSAETQSLPSLLQPLDSIPPSVPVNFTGRIDTTGYVYLNWNPAPEKDVAGYRIFRANSLNEDFVQITTEAVRFSEFRDLIPLKTLTEEIYYKVLSVDLRDNQSGFSVILKLKKPDKVPPVAPLFTNYKSGPAGISLYYTESPSQDVQEHLLLRVDEKKDSVKTILKPGLNLFTDVAVEPSERYSYFMYAVDDDGLLSVPSKIIVEGYNAGLLATKPVVAAKADKDQRHIVLSWNFEMADVKNFMIYRKKGDEPMRFYKAVDGAIFSFTDKQLYINNKYTYQVKAVFKNEDESEYSDLILISY